VKSCFLIATLLTLPLVSVCKAADSPASGGPETIDVQQIVREAVINFNTRESLPRNYSYVEKLTDTDSHLQNGHGTDTYEVMEINGRAFRRHIAHNDKSIAAMEDPEEDEAERAKWIEAERKILDEQIKPDHTRETLQIAVQKIMEESGLKDWKPQPLAINHEESVGVVYFAQTLHQFKLPIEELDQKFRLKARGEELRDGRKTYIVQADPLPTTDKTDVAANFKIKIWIDQQELQIVKIEGRALRAGPLARPDYAAFSSKTLSKQEIEDRKQKLTETRLFYGEGTVVMQEWIKVNDEAWLQRRRHIKGSYELVINESGTRPYFVRPNISDAVEYDTVYTNYKRFRVEHRILPVGTVPPDSKQ
jgi:hypothetical protein